MEQGRHPLRAADAMRVKALSFSDRSLIAVRAILRFASPASPGVNVLGIEVGCRRRTCFLATRFGGHPAEHHRSAHQRSRLTASGPPTAGSSSWLLLGGCRYAALARSRPNGGLHCETTRGSGGRARSLGTYPADQLALLIASADKADKRTRSIIELHFSAALLEYASDLQVGRFLPRKVDPNFFVQERSIDQVAALKEVASAPSIEQFFLSWEPRAPEYRALKAALADYRALAVAGGWPSVPLGDPLKPGMSDERVKALRARLAVTGAGLAQGGAGRGACLRRRIGRRRQGFPVPPRA